MKVLERKIIEVVKKSSICGRIKSIAIFGSYAKNRQTAKSDIDILISLAKPVGFDFFCLQENLNKKLKIKVDLLTESAISPYLRDEIRKTKKIIYEK